MYGLHNIGLIEPHEEHICFVTELFGICKILAVLFKLGFGSRIAPNHAVLLTFALTERGQVGFVELQRLLVYYCLPHSILNR